MDLSAIDQIMSAVNGMNVSGPNDNGDDMMNLMRSLPHRLPPQNQIQNKPSTPTPTSTSTSTTTTRVNRPADPVQSVSSAENLSSPSPDPYIKNNKYVSRNNQIKQNPTTIIKPKLKSTTPIPDPDTDVDTTDNNNDQTVIDSIADPTKAHLTSIMGYYVPTTTMYFIAILLIIAIALYFFTAEKKKPVKQEHDKGKRRDETE